MAAIYQRKAVRPMGSSRSMTRSFSRPRYSVAAAFPVEVQERKIHLAPVF